MASSLKTRVPEIIKKHQAELLATWTQEQLMSPGFRKDLLKEAELREQSDQFIRLLVGATQAGKLDSITGADWAAMRDFLTGVSKSRAILGFSPAETATFVFSFKRSLFEKLRVESGTDAAGLAEELWVATALLDNLGLFTTTAFQKTREDMIARQQEEMLELSTPVVKLWDGILALPMIGTLDSARTQVVMETLLQRIVETGSEVAIIDITGVPTVDTLVAQHLLKTVAAARLMGADCIISGIRPQIAQTMVHLAIDLSMVTTKANLADAFAVALQRSGRMIGKAAHATAAAPGGQGRPAANGSAPQVSTQTFSSH
jgi:rsbT co-antagonist protein RsbR